MSSEMAAKFLKIGRKCDAFPTVGKHLHAISNNLQAFPNCKLFQQFSSFVEQAGKLLEKLINVYNCKNACIVGKACCTRWKSAGKCSKIGKCKLFENIYFSKTYHVQKAGARVNFFELDDMFML